MCRQSVYVHIVMYCYLRMSPSRAPSLESSVKTCMCTYIHTYIQRQQNRKKRQSSKFLLDFLNVLNQIFNITTCGDISHTQQARQSSD